MSARRVVGIETEYGLTCARDGGGEPPLDAEATAAELFRPVLERTRSTNTFLPNGARLYLDVGAHPEYATAECDRLYDVLAQDLAGERIYADLARQATENLHAQGIDGTVHLLKNNHDAEGNSFGCHENYLVHRRPDYRARITSMLPFLVSRQIVCGAGHIHCDDGEASYEFSQRAGQMADAISAASTRSRPMVNTRDEPHGDAKKYRRMHVIVGDSNMCQATTAVKIAMTEAVLLAIEEGGSLPQVQLADPVRAIRIASADMTGRTPLDVVAGKNRSALDIQRDVRDSVLGFLNRSGLIGELGRERCEALELWNRALDAVESHDWDSISTEIDWAAKYALLQRYRERTGASLGDDRVLRLELAYHDITAGGLRAKMEGAGLWKVLIAESEVESACERPPQTTRAAIRGEFVRRAQAARRDYVVDWMNIRLLEASGPRSVVLADPFATYDEAAEALMEEIDS